MKHEMAERLLEGNFAGDRLAESSGPISIDLAVFTLVGRELSVLLTERTEPPYPGFWALPGSLRGPGVALDAQARALQAAVTGVEGGWIEQLKTFHRPQQLDSGGHVVVPGRDPRGDVLSVAYIAIVPVAAAEACAGDKGGGEKGRQQVVAAPLAEDLGERNVDVTTNSIVDLDLMGEAKVVARKPGVLSGSDAA